MRTDRPPSKAVRKTGRNDPCPCGSAEKYKRCCGQTRAEGTASALPEHLLQELRHLYATRDAPRQGFEEWLDRLVGIDIVRLVRQSDLTKTNFHSNLRAAVRGWGDDPDALAMIEIGADVVLPENETLRRDLGAYAARVQDLPGGGRSTALVAYAIPVGRTLFLYVMNSAAKSVLAADKSEDRGNPFTELLRSSIRRLSYSGWARTHREDAFDWQLQLTIPAMTRLVREESHGKAVWRTMKVYRTDLIVDGKRIDPTNDDEAFVFSVLSGLSAKELSEIVRRLFNQKLAIIEDGNYYGAASALPLTHDVATSRRSKDGMIWLETDKHQLVAREEAGERLARLVDHALETADGDAKGRVDWCEVARFAGQELGLMSRLPLHVRRGGKRIDETSDGGYGAIRTLLSEKYIDGWRTGQIYTDVKVPAQVSSSAVLRDLTVKTVVDGNGVSRYRIPVRFPRPSIHCENLDEASAGDESNTTICPDWHLDPAGDHKTHGWPIADAKLVQLRSLRARASEHGGGHERRKPLAGITHSHDFRGYIEGGFQYRLEPAASGVYRVERRPVPEDPMMGWDAKRDGFTDGYPTVCVLPSASFCAPKCPNACSDHITWQASVGSALEAALIGLSRPTSPLRLSSASHRAEGPTAEAKHQTAIAEAKAQLEDEEDGVTGANLILAKAFGKARGDEKHPKVKDALATVEAAETLRDAAAARLTRLEKCSTPAEPQEAERDLRPNVFDAAVLAVGLQKLNEPYADRIWNDLLRRYIVPSSVRFELCEAKTQVRWSLRFRLQDSLSGEWFELPLTGVVRNRVQQRQDGSLNRVSSAGELFFRDGQSFADVTAKLGLGGGKRDKNTRLWQLLHAFLRCDDDCPQQCRQHVTVPDLRTALIDTPVAMRALRRTVYAHVTGDSSAARGIPHPYRHHIVRTYTQTKEAQPHPWGWHWVGHTHIHERAILAVMEDPAEGISVAEAMARTGLDRATVLMPSKSLRAGSRPKKTIPPPRLQRTWIQNSKLSDDRKMLNPIPCPHSDCDARRNGKQGYCTSVVWTPETWSDSVICPDCRRCPGLPSVRFPAEYLLPWRGRCGPGALECGARDFDGSHLDPDFAPEIGRGV